MTKVKSEKPKKQKQPTIKSLTLKAHKAFLILVLMLCVVGLCGFTYMGIMTHLRSHDTIEFKCIVYLCVAIFDFMMLYIFALAFKGLRALRQESDEKQLKEFAMVIVALFTLLIALVAVVLSAENFIRTLLSA